MNKYENFKHLDAFYKKITKISGFKIEEKKGLIINTGIDFPAFNFVRFNTAVSQELETIIQKINLPFISFSNYEVEEERLSKAESFYSLTKGGDTIACVYSNLQEFEFFQSIPALRTQLVKNFDDLRNFDHISSHSLLHPEGYMKEFIKGVIKSHFNVEGLFCFVSYFNTVPVGQFFLNIHNDIPGVYFMNVLPNYRKQGIASEMVKACMAFARDLGYNQMVVQCMAASVNLFQRIGFEPYGSLSMFLYTPSEKILSRSML